MKSAWSMQNTTPSLWMNEKWGFILYIADEEIPLPFKNIEQVQKMDWFQG
jgi:hypothetical protein